MKSVKVLALAMLLLTSMIPLVNVEAARKSAEKLISVTSVKSGELD